MTELANSEAAMAQKLADIQKQHEIEAALQMALADPMSANSRKRVLSTLELRICRSDLSTISRFLERFLIERIELVCSLECDLTFISICSVRIRSRKRDIFEKPLQHISNRDLRWWWSRRSLNRSCRFWLWCWGWCHLCLGHH